MSNTLKAPIENQVLLICLKRQKNKKIKKTVFIFILAHFLEAEDSYKLKHE